MPLLNPILVFLYFPLFSFFYTFFSCGTVPSLPRTRKTLPYLRTMHLLGQDQGTLVPARTVPTSASTPSIPMTQRTGKYEITTSLHVPSDTKLQPARPCVHYSCLRRNGRYKLLCSVQSHNHPNLRWVKKVKIKRQPNNMALCFMSCTVRQPSATEPMSPFTYIPVDAFMQVIASDTPPPAGQGTVR